MTMEYSQADVNEDFSEKITALEEMNVALQASCTQRLNHCLEMERRIQELERIVTHNVTIGNLRP